MQNSSGSNNDDNNSNNKIDNDNDSINNDYNCNNNSNNNNNFHIQPIVDGVCLVVSSLIFSNKTCYDISNGNFLSTIQRQFVIENCFL